MSRYAYGQYVITPYGEGRIVRVITHPVNPIVYRVNIRGTDYDFYESEIELAD